MSVLIRKALPSDAEEMAAVHIRSWEAAYAGIVPDQTIAEKNAARPALWKKLLSEDGKNLKYAICEDERIVGLMILNNPEDKTEEESTLEVGCLYISPEV